VKTNPTVTSDQWQVTSAGSPAARVAFYHSPLVTRRSSLARAFTLVEVLVVMTLLTLIVIALMGVFSSTQSAFRASLTQTDVLESGRAAMDLITSDLRTMTPSGGVSNGPVNFYVGTYGYAPLLQPLVGANSPNTQRTNVQQNIFILSQGNANGVPTWTGTGYAVLLTPSNTYSLYRFSTNLPVAQAGAAYNLSLAFFNNFWNSPSSYSHLLDGVVGFRVHAFDPKGSIIGGNFNYVMPNGVVTNSLLNQPQEIGYVFYSNAVPAAVEIELATLEDRALQRASSRPSDNAPYPNDSRTQYLESQAGRVHIFRQRVAIPNAIPAAYP
jgi:type II secretory pathway pseudopilin PulG